MMYKYAYYLSKLRIDKHIWYTSQGQYLHMFLQDSSINTRLRTWSIQESISYIDQRLRRHLYR